MSVPLAVCVNLLREVLGVSSGCMVAACLHGHYAPYMFHVCIVAAQHKQQDPQKRDGVGHSSSDTVWQMLWLHLVQASVSSTLPSIILFHGGFTEAW